MQNTLKGLLNGQWVVIEKDTNEYNDELAILVIDEKPELQNTYSSLVIETIEEGEVINEVYFNKNTQQFEG